MLELLVVSYQWLLALVPLTTSGWASRLTFKFKHVQSLHVPFFGFRTTWTWTSVTRFTWVERCPWWNDDLQILDFITWALVVQPRAVHQLKPSHIVNRFCTTYPSSATHGALWLSYHETHNYLYSARQRAGSSLLHVCAAEQYGEFLDWPDPQLTALKLPAWRWHFLYQQVSRLCSWSW